MTHVTRKFRKRPVRVRATQLQEPRIIETREGTETANAGDWIVTGGGGESWPISNKKFLEKYTPLLSEPGVFIANEIIVSARLLDAPLTLKTSWGVQSGAPGDWLVTDEENSQYICDSEAFARSYTEMSI